MADTVLVIGTRKGLLLARSTDRRTWELSEPEFPMNAVAAVAIDLRRSPPRLLAGTDSPHWGPSVRRRRRGGPLDAGGEHLPDVLSLRAATLA